MRGVYARFRKWDDNDAGSLSRSRAANIAEFSINQCKPSCTVCFDLHPRNLPKERDLKMSSSTLQQSAKSGCQVCSLICRALECYLWLDEAEKLTRDIVFKATIAPGEPVLLAQDASTPYLQSIMLYTPLGAQPAWDSLGSVPEICDNTKSKECLALVNKWMTECVNLHESCNGHCPSKLPKRVVDVGLDNADMRLLEEEGLEARYAALSHCWGKKRPLKTTFSTLHPNKQKLEWTSMPPTFRDAIMLTRELGLRYLWIDSLCINQDDDRDWEIESSKMGSIFAAAHIVIAATGSPDPDCSFLAPRQTRFATPFALTYQREDGSECIVKARPVVEMNPYREPLDRRAWTFQEQRRATRLLRFSGTELEWNCRTKSSCECESVHIIGFDGHEMYGKFCVEDGDCSQQKLFHQWQTGIHAYTRRQLTRESDRLPAISGIAAFVHENTDSSYLAGLWKDNLVSDLQWKIVPTLRHDADLRTKNVFQFPLLRKLPFYRAPTFSWASIDTETGYRDDLVPQNPDLDAIVHEAKCTLKGVNPFGEVTDGFVLLEAFMVQACIATSERRDEDDPIYTGLYELTRDGMHKLMRADLPLVEGQGWGQSGERKRTLKRASIGDEPKPLTGPVSCVLLSENVDGGIVALVLGLSPTVPEAYERLGLVEFHSGTTNYGPTGDEWFAGAETCVVKIV